MLTVDILGPFTVRSGQCVITPTAPKVREVLALLALKANHVVHTDQLIEELWQDTPPVSAVTTLQTYVYQLRKRFALGAARAGSADPGAVDESAASRLLQTSSNGYMLAVDPDAIDVKRFERIANLGKDQLAEGSIDEARATLREALTLWRGPALSDICVGPVLQASSVWLNEMGKSVREQRIAVDLQLGRHHELIGELTAVVGEDPTHEGFQSKLILALYRCGRRADALQAFQNARRALDDALGVDPSPKLVDLHRAILNADEHLDLPTREPLEHTAPAPRPGAAISSDTGPAELSTTSPRPASPAPAAAQAHPCPRHIPADIPFYIGRTRELAMSRELLEDPERNSPPVLVVTGAPGAGKTAFSVHTAHLVQEAYPDGLLHAELTDADGSPADPEDILETFLWALNVPRSEIPDGVAKRSSLLRSLTTDKRVLFVLDDAMDNQQITPLLPSGPGCATLLSTRRRFVSRFPFITITLRPFSAPESMELLSGLLGPRRLRDNMTAMSELVELCGGLPLALRQVAGDLATHPHWPVQRELHRIFEPRPIDDDEMVRSLLRTWTSMPTPLRSALRTLGTSDQPLSVTTAAHSLCTDETSAESVLEDLVAFHLVDIANGDIASADPATGETAVTSFGAGDRAGDGPTDPADAGRYHYRLPSPVRIAARSLPEPVLPAATERMAAAG